MSNYRLPVFERLSAFDCQKEFDLSEMNRKVVNRNTRAILDALSDVKKMKDQLITAKVSANHQGAINYVELIDDETTIVLSTQQQEKIIEAIYGYRLEAKPNVVEDECTKIKIVIKEINVIE